MNLSKNKPLISVVISVYNEEGNLVELHKEITTHLKNYNKVDYELIFVNDGSADGSLLLLRNLLKQDDKIHIVNFSRNFGHEIAMTAGLDHSKGEAVIFMDADLQHPPHLLPEIIDKWFDGNDVVLTKIINNEDKSLFRKFLSKSFYKIINIVSDVEIPENTPDFRLIGGEYVKTLKDMRENTRMFRGMLNWLGIKDAPEIKFVAPKRFSGQTNYTLTKSFRLAMDSILQFSVKPLRISLGFSIACALLSLTFGIFTIYEHYVLHQPSGYATIICLITLLSSLQFIILAILGEYIGRIHIESKNRPLYFCNVIENENRN